jgi:hypothetical protein
VPADRLGGVGATEVAKALITVSTDSPAANRTRWLPVPNWAKSARSDRCASTVPKIAAASASPSRPVPGYDRCERTNGGNLRELYLLE